MKKLEKLLDIITPNTAGIIWYTDIALKEHPYPFYSLNYLFNNILAKTETFSGNTLLYSNNFGKPLFLYHTPFLNQNMFEVIDKLFKIDPTKDVVLIGNSFGSLVEKLNCIVKVWN